MGALPNLVAIGAMKCGTSALHYYLGLHPEIAMSSPKELNFFAAEADPARLGGTEPPELRRMRGRAGNWGRGAEWYAQHFPADAPVRGEASPAYTSPWHPDAAERMAAVLPEARLVFLVRDPVEQIVSHYMHYRALGVESRTLGRALDGPGSPYVERARYHARLLPFLERFGRERIWIGSQEELRDYRRATLASIFSFLGVAEDFWSERMLRPRHETAGKNRRVLLMNRVQRSPLARPAFRLSPEVKWQIERLAYSRGGRGAERPEPAPQLRERLAVWLGEDGERLREVAGRELGW